MNLESINGYHNTHPDGDLYVILEISESNGELVTVRGYDDQGNGEYFPFGKNVSLLYNTISHLERKNFGEYMVKHTYYELRATVGRFLYKLKNTNQNGCCF